MKLNNIYPFGYSQAFADLPPAGQANKSHDLLPYSGGSHTDRPELERPSRSIDGELKLEDAGNDLKLDLNSSLSSAGSSFSLNQLNQLSQINQLNQLSSLNEDLFKTPFNGQSMRPPLLHQQLCDNLGRLISAVMPAMSCKALHSQPLP